MEINGFVLNKVDCWWWESPDCSQNITLNIHDAQDAEHDDLTVFECYAVPRSDYDVLHADAKFGKEVKSLIENPKSYCTWEALNNIRLDLIDRKFNKGISVDEEKELKILQQMSYIRRNAVMPLPKI